MVEVTRVKTTAHVVQEYTLFHDIDNNISIIDDIFSLDSDDENKTPDAAGSLNDLLGLATKVIKKPQETKTEDDADEFFKSGPNPIESTDQSRQENKFNVADDDIKDLIDPDYGKDINIDLSGGYKDDNVNLHGSLNVNKDYTDTSTEDMKKYTKVLDIPDGRTQNDDQSINSGLSASLRYLGSGYDIVFGNPLGDPIVMMDQGYRNPVIKLNWDIEYSNKDGANLKEPYGSWIRPEYSCRQAESIDHINSVEDFKKELSMDAQASVGIPFFFSFTGSTGYKNFVRSTATNNIRTYILKTYCLRYVAGIVNYDLMETTSEFQNAVNKLPKIFDTTKCTLDVFKANDNDDLCIDTVTPWMNFIKMFGTHFTTIVHLGGKITNQVQIKKSDVLKMQKYGINIDAKIKATLSLPLLDSIEGGTTFNNEQDKSYTENNFKYDKQVIVIGGEELVDSKDINSVSTWARELYKKPMPIKTKLESIKSLLTSQSLKNSFDLALKFYSETYGVTPDEIYTKYGKDYGIASLVQKGHQVVYSGTRSGSAVCPNKTVVLMGYSMLIHKSKNNIFEKDEYVIHIAPCPVGDEKCIVTNDMQNTEARIWAVCGTDPIPLLTQETATSVGAPAKATCPAGFSIAYGFALSVPRGNVALKSDAYPCRTGTNSCSHVSYDAKGANAVWIACVENGAPQLSDISNHTISTSNPVCSSRSKENVFVDNMCPHNSLLIAGWDMYLSDTNNALDKRYDTCSRGVNGCIIDKYFQSDSDCRAYFSWVSCLNVNLTEMAEHQLRTVKRHNVNNTDLKR